MWETRFGFAGPHDDGLCYDRLRQDISTNILIGYIENISLS